MRQLPLLVRVTACGFALACLLAQAAGVRGDDAQAQVQPVPIGGGPAKNQFVNVPVSHVKAAEIEVKSSDGKHRLQTLGIDAEGRVLALAAMPKSFGAPVKNTTSEVHVFSPEGKAVQTLKVDFHASAVAGAPDGHIYVAGDGKVVKFSRDGKQMAVITLPHVELVLKDKDGPRKQAEQQLKAQRESMENVVKTYKERVKALEAKKEEDRTPLEKKQLDQFKQILKNYEPRLNDKNDALLDQLIAQTVGRLYTINALTFSKKDVFVVCGDTKGFGYAVWRMDHQFQNPKQVLAGVRGCCGQMDVQTAGDDLLVAENTSHRFARYDRDGQPLGNWGKRAGAQGELECFGGCCNPMNLRPVAKGDVFTAESEGFIKRFSAKGDFLGLVATVPLAGAGCKNVAFAVSPDEQRIYFLDLNASRFLILEQKKAAK